MTELSGTTGEFKPATITTEYDVPEDAWYAVDGGVPPAVTVEAGQCDLLLVSYLGIDFKNKGERVYRLLDSTLIFRGNLPQVGQTLRYDISIDRFVHQGETTLFFFSYKCYADGELILELHDACAGFFSQAELDTPLGVVMTDKEKAERGPVGEGLLQAAGLHREEPPLEGGPGAARRGPPEGRRLRPRPRAGPGHQPGAAAARREAADDRRGRHRPQGRTARSRHAQRDQEAAARRLVLPGHFPDDHVLAGSLVAEGAVQLLQIYLLHQGMHLTLPDARFQCVTDRPIEVQVRGQITQAHEEIRYEVEIMEISLLPRATVIADVLIYLGDKPVIRMKGLGLQVREKDGSPYRPEIGGVPSSWAAATGAARRP